MTDYGRTLKAVDLVLGTTGYETYLAKSSEIQGDIADNDTVVQAIVKFMAPRNDWSGSMTDLLELLTSGVDANSLKWFPTQPIRLSRRITELDKPLAARGIGWKKNKGTKRSITLTRIVEPPVETEEVTDDALQLPVEANFDDFEYDTNAGVESAPAQSVGADDTQTSAARQSELSPVNGVCTDCGLEASDLRTIGGPDGRRLICAPCNLVTDDF
jgi:hypothetical protein